ncbi:MAG TPA: glycosyltransferase family 4 protein [Candidatus Acidoferrales bacterium]|nr:glycosyltransferase family 4 protein [Candidatus Acidoferrales bacterium]
MARNPRVDTLVAYCSLDGAESYQDPGFGVKVAWDVPLLQDYSWTQIRNISPRPEVGSVLGLINPSAWKLIRRGRFDAVVVLTGYLCATFWIALAAAKLSGTPILFGTDSTTLHPQNGRTWKAGIKRLFWPWLFQLSDVVIVPSNGAAALMRSLRIPQDRIQLTPYVVDNDWWTESAKRVDRKAVRRSWGVPEDASVILFCAKLQPWKRPQDLLRAFARAHILNSYLIYAGDGSMRGALEREAVDLGVQERVRFLGFVNQSGLPQVYCSSDLMVLPSEYEPFGVVVNEAMLCQCPVIVSDRVGAHVDLVRENETGFTYPCGDLDALAGVLRKAFESRDHLKQMGNVARARMSEWSPEINIEATLEAMEKAIRFKKRT